MELQMGELEKEQLRYEDSSENLYEFMYDETDTYFKSEKNRKNQKKTQPQQTNVVTNPYVIYEYSDDTVQVLRTDELFPPGHNLR